MDKEFLRDSYKVSTQISVECIAIEEDKKYQELNNAVQKNEKNIYFHLGKAPEFLTEMLRNKL